MCAWLNEADGGVMEMGCVCGQKGRGASVARGRPMSGLCGTTKR